MVGKGLELHLHEDNIMGFDDGVSVWDPQMMVVCIVVSWAKVDGW